MTAPLDPASDRGRDLTARLTAWLARTELAIEEREARTAAQAQQEVSTAA